MHELSQRVCDRRLDELYSEVHGESFDNIICYQMIIFHIIIPKMIVRDGF